MIEVQSIYFRSPTWSSATSKIWLKKHNFKPMKKVHISGNLLRYRLRPTSKYTTFRTHEVGKHIYFVYGLT